MKRFAIGFVIGVGLMYYYLHYAELAKSSTFNWFQGSASSYRGDARHRAAQEALGEGERGR